MRISLSAITQSVLLLLCALKSASFMEDNSTGTTMSGRRQSTTNLRLQRSGTGVLRERDVNGTASRTPTSDFASDMHKSSKSRFRAEVKKDVENFCNSLNERIWSWAEKTRTSPDAARAMAHCFFNDDDQLEKLFEESPRKGEKRGHAATAIAHSFQGIWGDLSAPHVLASNEGWKMRRLLLSSVSGPDTTFQQVSDFTGGSLSHEAFNKAKTRREEAIRDEDPHLLIGDRKLRSDRLEVTCPDALAWIQERIIFHTQPSPCDVKVKHDHGEGNHMRSEADNSWVCKFPDRCSTMPVQYLMGTKTQLYETIMKEMEDARVAMIVEVASISRASFDKLVPFYVVEQSSRACLCVYCYKAKLITIGLFDLWPTLHRGETPASPCTCKCSLCDGGGCTDYLPYSSRKDVYSMGKFSDQHMCEKEDLYTSRDGTRIRAHKSACVTGNCLKCRRKQDDFFNCPRHKGGPQRPLYPAPVDPAGGPPPGEVRWNMFTEVDDRGQATTTSTTRTALTVGDDGDEYIPPGSGRNKNRQAVAVKKGTVDDLIHEFSTNFSDFILHRRQYKMQRIAFNEKRLTLEDGEVVCVVDFQERLQVKEQDQVQSQHWNQDATTIFPCPIYFRWRGRTWAYSFMILSDDMGQDNSWVQHVMTRLLKEDIPALLRKLGAPPMVHVTIFTDNCAKQFKCRFHFGWIADAGIMCRDRAGALTGKRVKIEHHYFGPCHGKNPSDGEGGAAKTYVKMMVKNQRWSHVECSKDLCSKLQKGMGFIYREATDEERTTFLATRPSRRGGGTDKLFMTKTWIGEGATAPQQETLLLTKNPNTFLGRRFIFIAAGEISSAVRKAARSVAKQIEVKGCQAVGRIAATNIRGIVAVSQLSCFCSRCLDDQPEGCPLIRRGVMAAPLEYSRRNINGEENDDDDDDILCAKEFDLERCFEYIQLHVPYGSTALLRVDPSQNNGNDVVPVIVARKAPCPFTRAFAVDGMFESGDTMLWIVDLEQADTEQEGGPATYVVPDLILAADKYRAVPLRCIAGLGQGMGGYMEHVATQDSTKHFALRPGVMEAARSNMVLMSTKPLSAFKNFSPVELSAADLDRAPVRPKLFREGSRVTQVFKGPVSGTGKRMWRSGRRLEATVTGVRTLESSRRHQYKLQWLGDDSIIREADPDFIVDEG